MSKKALITGSEGFVASHLVKHLESKDYQIVGFNMKDGLDIRDYEQVRDIIDIYRPDVIFHLAAQAFVPESFSDPRRAFDVNTIGSLNILEAVKNLGVKTRIHMAGTSEEYGDSLHGEGETTELTLPTPLSPYAISKLAMDNLGNLYAKSYGMDVVVTRAFNHTGVGRGEMYAEASWAKQIAEIEVGLRDTLQHGNLDTVRNYTDVRDIVVAYEKAVYLPSGTYNICSDQNVTMKEVLDILTSMSDTPISREVNASLFRPADFSFKIPSCKKFTDLVDWTPQYKLEDTLQAILSEWRKKVLS